MQNGSIPYSRHNVAPSREFNLSAIPARPVNRSPTLPRGPVGGRARRFVRPANGPRHPAFPITLGGLLLPATYPHGQDDQETEFPRGSEPLRLKYPRRGDKALSLMTDPEKPGEGHWPSHRLEAVGKRSLLH